MKSIVALFLCLSFLTNGFAGDGKYAVDKINPLLKLGANAVVRYEHLQVEIINVEHYTYTKHFAITILNENGNHWADIDEYYDRFMNIKNWEGKLFDAAGEEIKTLKSSDIKDLSAVSDNNLMDDSRKKTHNFFYKNYPYTIEYSISFNCKGTLFLPRWMPQLGSNLAVEQSTFDVSLPLDFEIRYNAQNYSGNPTITQTSKQKKMAWHVENIPARKLERFSPPWSTLVTNVNLAPIEFEMENYKGNMNTWQGLGKFVSTLQQNRFQLPTLIKAKVHEIADSLPNDWEKIKALYAYLQKNTRYISIQLGIGGWQPFDAEYVGNKGYGDCKALTNYMYSLLKEVNIRAIYAPVKAGSNISDINANFPYQAFNHVILCIPQNKDSIWLECTSTNLPAGYLSSFTQNRYALLADGDQSKLVRTPKFDEKTNIQINTIKGELLDGGHLDFTTHSIYQNERQDEWQQLLYQLPQEKIKEHIEKGLGFATFEVTHIAHEVISNRNPTIKQTLGLKVSHYASITGRRIFINPNVLTKLDFDWQLDTLRNTPITIKEAFTEIDSVEIIIPTGYSAELLPGPVAEKTNYGSFESSCTIEGNRLKLIRRFTQRIGTYGRSDFPKLFAFYQKIYKTDRSKIVLVKKEE